MVRVLPLRMSMVLLRLGTVEVEFWSKMRMVLLPVTSILDVEVPNVVFQVPMARVPATRRVPPLQVLAPP